jgi:hypothetical protein
MSDDGKRVEDLGTYEMLWDCPYCGTKKLLGVSQRHCPECGGAQDPSKRYFPSDAEKVAVGDHPYAGADLLCPFCQAPCSARAKNCTACGGELEKAKEAMRRGEQVVAEGQAFAGESAADAKRDFAAQKAAAKAPPKPAPKPRAIWPFVVGGIAALVAVILVLVLWRKPAAVVVTGHTWERQIAVERFGPVKLSEWCDHLPLDARMVFRHREVRSHEKVQDGETCVRKRVDKGNGSFAERKECTPKYKDIPVYSDKCDFTADRWAKVAPLTTSGSKVEDTPRWPDTSTLRRGQCIGCEREAGRSEKYTVALADPRSKMLMTCDLPPTRWSAMKVGSRWRVKVGVLTKSPDCDSLEPL